MQTIPITKQLNANIKQPKVLLCYDFVNGITYEKEKILLYVELELIIHHWNNYPTKIKHTSASCCSKNRFGGTEV
jgi:hypothetical protein